MRDPRVSEEDNNHFIDVIERYFDRPEENVRKDCRPDIAYQVGPTPEGVEVPRCTVDVKCKELIQSFPDEHKPKIPTGPDHKWRFLHRIGDRPMNTKFPSLNERPVEPEGFPEWIDTLNRWGNKLLICAFTLAEMLEVGLDLPKGSFTNLMVNGPHLLAPTASDLDKYGLGTILAGFHQDLNFLTFHGKSRFAGLFVWLRDGTKMPVVVPNGCILAQAGMELEHLTGGYIKAGYHEVIISEKTIQQVEVARKEKKHLWRISSTLFSHISSDSTLTVLYGTEEEKQLARQKYKDILAGDHVNNELKFIKLSRD
jgi:isopenicillin N synthase-like dioxygenase